MPQRIGRLVRIHGPHSLVHILQVEEVALAELRIVIKVVDVSLAGERCRILELDGPDRVICAGEGSGVQWVGSDEWQADISAAIVKPADLVEAAVPPRVQELLAVRILGQVPVRIVREYVARVIKDDVEDNPHTVSVCGIHEFLEIVGCAELGVDLQGNPGCRSRDTSAGRRPA